MCCSGKSVEVIDSSYRYPENHGTRVNNMSDVLKNKNSNSNENKKKFTSDQKILLKKGEKAVELGNYNEAIEIYKELIVQYPDNENGYFNLGKIYIIISCHF